jgi:hypothetical protein
MRMVSSPNQAEPPHAVHAHEAIETGIPIVDDIDARMATIKEILVVAGMSLLERYSLIAEWVYHAETKISVSGQVVRKPQGGRPEGGVAKASRELSVPGKTQEARRKFVERAVKINALWEETKEAARAAGLDDTQSALLAIAGEHSLEAQVAKVLEIATRKAAPRKSSTRVGGDSSGKMVAISTAQPGSAVRSPNVMHNVAVEEIGSPPTVPLNDENIPDFLDRRPLSPEDKRAFDRLMAAWAALMSAWEGASSVVHARFKAEADLRKISDRGNMS